MRRFLAIVMVLAGLSLAFLPSLSAEDWKESKTKLVQFDKKASPQSPVFAPAAISGDRISLPTKSGSMKVKIEAGGKKVMVDVKGKGKADFKAVQGTKITPFTLQFVYADGTKTKYHGKIVKNGRTFAFIRDCAMEVSIDGTKFWFVDDNSNGIYGEDKDAIYYDKKDRGCPNSSLVISKGKVYEVKINDSGTVVSYRPYSGTTGTLDITKEWTGKDKPETIIVQSGDTFLDVASSGEILVPNGDFKLVVAFLPDVIISRGDKTNFTVTEGEAATMKWGLKMKISAQLSVKEKKGKKEYTLSPTPVITGIAGERYSGKFMEDARFHFEVTLSTANGKPIGRPSKWSMCASWGGSKSFQAHTGRVESKSEAVTISAEVKGVGKVSSIIPF